jgi:hypothetical protein
MKILGVGDNKYICEIDMNEMMTIMGMDNMYDVGEMLQAGKEVDMARTIKAARWLRNLDGKHLDQTIAQVKEVLAGVEKVKETAVALNLFNKLAEEQV